MIGWRVWRVTKSGKFILSPHTPEVWVPGEAVTADSTPSPDGATGLYACRTQSELWENQMLGRYGVPDIVWGRVSMWGTVIEHVGGYRATHMYPMSISCPRLARIYGCEVESYNPALLPTVMRREDAPYVPPKPTATQRAATAARSKAIRAAREIALGTQYASWTQYFIEQTKYHILSGHSAYTARRLVVDGAVALRLSNPCDPIHQWSDARGHRRNCIAQSYERAMGKVLPCDRNVVPSERVRDCFGCFGCEQCAYDAHTVRYWGGPLA